MSTTTLSLDLSVTDADFLRAQIDRRVQEVDNELVHTDKRELQRALAIDLERLLALQARLAELVTDGQGG